MQRKVKLIRHCQNRKEPGRRRKRMVPVQVKEGWLKKNNMVKEQFNIFISMGIA